MIDLKVNKNEYDKLNDYLVKKNENIDDYLNNKLKETLAYYDKSLTNYKDSQILKDIVNNIKVNKEKTNISRIAKKYNIGFVAAGEVYTALELLGIVYTNQIKEVTEKDIISFKIEDDLLELSNEIFKERSMLFLNDFIDYTIKNAVKNEVIDFSIFDNDKKVQDFIKNTKDLKNVSIVKIQINLQVGYVKAKQVLRYIEEKVLK